MIEISALWALSRKRSKHLLFLSLATASVRNSLVYMLLLDDRATTPSWPTVRCRSATAPCGGFTMDTKRMECLHDLHATNDSISVIWCHARGVPERWRMTVAVTSIPAVVSTQIAM
jgi:hypothetical protein